MRGRFVSHPLANLFPLLCEAELEALAQDIQDNGLHHAVVIFDGQVLDGRNRLAACELAGVAPRFETFTGTDDEALALVISLNLQRRHLTTAQKAVLALQLLPHEQRLAEQRMHAGRPPSDREPPQIVAGVPVAARTPVNGEATALAGARVGVSKEIVRRTRRIAEEAPEVFEAMQDGTLTSVASATKLAALPPTKRRRLLTRIREEGLTLAQAENVYRRGADEDHANWFTPPDVTAAVVQALGGPIDLDPASCQEANEIVGAARYFTTVDDGLLRDWRAERLFCNPPFGLSGNGSNQGAWVRKALNEFEAGHFEKAVLLVRNSVEAEWFWPLWRFPVCLVRGRLPFVPGPGTRHGRPTVGSAIVGMGIAEDAFEGAFGHFGRVVEPKRL